MLKVLIGVVVVIVGIGAGVYYLQGQFDAKVKAEVLTLVDKMDLTPDERAEVRGMVETFHARAFKEGREAGKAAGGPFAGDRYLDVLFDAMQRAARDRGR